MSKIEQPGRYPAVVKSAELGESGKGTPFINLACETTETEQPCRINAFIHLSDKAFAGSLKTLREAFGFDGNFETVIQQITEKPCSLTVENETDENGVDRLRVRWVNPPGSGGTTKPIADQATFLKNLSAKAARMPVAASVAAAPTRATAAARPPMATRPTAAATSVRAAPAPAGGVMPWEEPA